MPKEKGNHLQKWKQNLLQLTDAAKLGPTKK
jgi:hypothetical protein